MYLFVTYGLFILMLLAIFFTFTYSHYRQLTITDSSRELENMGTSIESSLTAQLDNLSTISMNIVYSNAIKTNFREFSEFYSQSGPSQLVASREKALAIHDIITAMVGAFQTAAKINIYTMDGSFVESGYWQRSGTIDLEQMSWYQEVIARNGHKFITLPATHLDLPGKGENQKHLKFISLLRLFLDMDGQPEGIVEVVQDCGTIFSLVSQLERQNPGSQVSIYNERQELVYPYFTVSPAGDYLLEMKELGLVDGGCDFFRTAEDEYFLATGHTMSDYGWTILLLKSREAVYAPLRSYRLLFLAITGCSILLTMVICFSISWRLTEPLQKLTEATGKITINRVLDEHKVNLTSADSSIMELSQLCESIRTMYEKLRATSKEALLAKSEETRAKLQATQSLVNPHFLYNCLTTISIMAEEEMNETIVTMCQALCDYFRYISSSQDTLVSLEEEIFYTKRYLECMQLRFSDEFTYETIISPDTKKLLIPRLILQPIVENAFKYAFNISPPWKLTITSVSTTDGWLLKITDNGGRLGIEKKEELLKLFWQLDLNQELKRMEIGGMGLKNVYLRLKLLYGERAVFRIETTPNEETTFIIGGPTGSGEEDYGNECRL